MNHNIIKTSHSDRILFVIIYRLYRHTDLNSQTTSRQFYILSLKQIALTSSPEKYIISYNNFACIIVVASHSSLSSLYCQSKDTKDNVIAVAKNPFATIAENNVCTHTHTHIHWTRDIVRTHRSVQICDIVNNNIIMYFALPTGSDNNTSEV